jgi:hypothetical protein
MSWLKKGCVCLGLVFILDGTGRGAAETIDQNEESAKLTILFFDFVSLPEKIQKPMQEKAERIYRQAGVGLEWAPCPTQEGTLAFYPNCTGYKEKTHMMLRILRTAPKGMETDAKGEALLGPRIVNVFWDRVQKEASRYDVPVADMLAQVIAHEIGHLLLGSNSHSLSGIMMGKWRLGDLGSISRGGISFTPQQREQIQAEVGRRQHQMSQSAERKDLN